MRCPEREGSVDQSGTRSGAQVGMWSCERWAKQKGTQISGDRHETDRHTDARSIRHSARRRTRPMQNRSEITRHTVQSSERYEGLVYYSSYTYKSNSHARSSQENPK